MFARPKEEGKELEWVVREVSVSFVCLELAGPVLYILFPPEENSRQGKTIFYLTLVI